MILRSKVHKTGTLFPLLAITGLLVLCRHSYASEETGDALGFVVHGIGNALARSGQIEAMCPEGRSLGYLQIFKESEDGRRRTDEPVSEFNARMNAGAFTMATHNGRNLCANPELGPPDPHYRLMTSSGIVSYGIDLDGQVSSASGSPTPGTCSHEDFIGVDGTPGVDNQMARVVGCDGAGEQYAALDESSDIPSGENGVSEMMLQGGWGILITLTGVDDLENDGDVGVGIYANADPIVLGPSKEPIPYATYAMDQDPRFRGETKGKIVNGVLTTEPVDVRFHWLVAGLHLERPLNHARLHVTFNDAGGIEGYLAGYTPVEAMYDINYGFRNARGDDGNIVPPERTRMLSVLGNSVMGRTCHGAYTAMYQLADGDPDPETGRCTSISTQYWIRATPAFVVDVETQSSNQDLN